ncbi:MAG: GIY-YIG nuclease family protein [Chitinophagales bacterium]
MVRGACVYILTNKNNTTLYTGVTSDLQRRIVEHKTHYYPKSFTARYNLTKLVYFESYSSVEEAIQIEKRIKAGSRIKKEELINSINPKWDDLYVEVEKW